MAQTIRQTDILGRWGGEEFLIIAPFTGAGGAMRLGQKVVETIQAHTFCKGITITVSAGVSGFKGNESEKELFVRADRALYRAKELGKNRVEKNI
jgi:diguanylate cyclase (GGDEF)-like protein